MALKFQPIWDYNIHLFSPLYSIIRHVTNETTLADGVDSTQMPDKTLQNKEKQQLAQYQSMLQKLLHDKPKLQLTSIYALQVHCYNNNFPKGMLTFHVD